MALARARWLRARRARRAPSGLGSVALTIVPAILLLGVGGLVLSGMLRSRREARTAPLRARIAEAYREIHSLPLRSKDPQMRQQAFMELAQIIRRFPRGSFNIDQDLMTRLRAQGVVI